MATQTSTGSDVSGICLGFEVSSSLPFRLLRAGSGQPLRVFEHDGTEPDVDPVPLMSWPSRPTLPFERRIHRCDTGFAVWHEAMGWFIVDPSGPSILVPPHADPRRLEDRIWGLPALLCAVHRGDLAMHGAAVDVEGSAIVFCAPGAFGKTTLSGAFLRAGHRLLADDLSCCRLDLEPVVIPGPAVLRIRPDVYRQMEFPGTELVAQDEHKVYLVLRPEVRGSGSPVPIRALVFLRKASLQASEGRPPLYPISTKEAIQNLWTINFWLPTSESREQTFHGVAALADKVSTWEMYRPTSFDDLSGAVDQVVATCLSAGGS